MFNRVALMRPGPIECLQPYGKLDREDGSGPIGPVRCLDGAVHRVDKASTDRKTKPGPSAHPVTFANTVEFVEDPLEIVRRNAVAFIQNLKPDKAVILPSANLDDRACGRILCCIVEQVEQHLFEQYRVDPEHRKIGVDLHLGPVLLENLAGAL
jgi:hypothetical protein